MRRPRRFTIAIIALVMTSVCTASQLGLAQSPAQPEAPAPAKRTLIVGTKEAPPFAIKNPDGSWRGISIELWREIARDLHVDYEFRETSLTGLFNGVQSGEFDLAIAAISITADRESLFDFTQPYYNSGLGIAVNRKKTSNFFDVLLKFMSWDILRLVGALLFTTIIMGTFMWFLERRNNAEQFGGKWGEGLVSGVWWSAVTLTTVGYGDKTPKTNLGRLVALLWMVSAIIIVSSFTATMTTTLTIARLETSIKGPEDLSKVRVGTIANATSENYLRQHGVTPTLYQTPLDGLNELEAGNIEAMVYDAPMLSYWSNQGIFKKVMVLPVTFDKHNYGIALAPGSPLRKPINQAILKKLRSPEWQELLRRNLGDPEM